MAQKIKLGFQVDTTDVENANDEIIKLEQEIAELKDKMKSLEEGTDSFKKIEDQVKKTEKEVGGLKKSTGLAGRAFVSVGNIIKGGLGLGFIQQILSVVTDLFMQNQEVVDAVNVAFTALSIVVNEFFGAIKEAFMAVSEANGGFNATKEVILGLLTIALTPLKLQFYSIKLAILTLQLAWEKSVFGKGDEGRITELTEKIDSTKESMKQTGIEALKAGKQVVDNFGEMVGEVAGAAVAVGTAAINTIKDVNVEATIEQAKAITEGEKSLEKLEIQQQGLIEKYDREAEIQRQIRDDVSLSFEERIAANEELGRILTEQTEAERSNITQRIGLLQSQNNLLGKTEERTNEILRLQNELAAVDARVTGQRSEQLTNTNALLKEQADVEASRLDTKRQIADLEAQTELNAITNLEQRLVRERELLLQSSEARKADLQEQMALYNEGTAERVRLENEYALEVANTNAKVNDLDNKLKDQRVKTEQEVQKARVDGIASTLGSISGLIGAFADENKVAAKAAVLVDAAVAAIGIWRGYAKLGPFGIAGAALQTAALIVATKKSLQNIDKASRGATTGGGGYQAPPAVSQAAISQNQAPIPTSITVSGTGLESTTEVGTGAGSRQQSVRAYVVESDITETQNRLSTYQQRAEIG